MKLPQHIIVITYLALGIQSAPLPYEEFTLMDFIPEDQPDPVFYDKLPPAEFASSVPFDNYDDDNNNKNTNYTTKNSTYYAGDHHHTSNECKEYHMKCNEDETSFDTCVDGSYITKDCHVGKSCKSNGNGFVWCQQDHDYFPSKYALGEGNNGSGDVEQYKNVDEILYGDYSYDDDSTGYEKPTNCTTGDNSTEYGGGKYTYGEDVSGSDSDYYYDGDKSSSGYKLKYGNSDSPSEHYKDQYGTESSSDKWSGDIDDEYFEDDGVIGQTTSSNDDDLYGFGEPVVASTFDDRFDDSSDNSDTSSHSDGWSNSGWSDSSNDDGLSFDLVDGGYVF